MNQMTDGNQTSPLLEVKNLVTSFQTDKGPVNAVDDVSFKVYPGKTLGIVGESGCGKSVTSLSIMRLIPNPPGKIRSGKILYDGKDLLALSESEMRHYRGHDISMIFQEPMTSLNPVFTIGDQVGEPLRIHKGYSRKQARDQAIELLKMVNIPSPHTRIDEYPHQLSGGMRQRVMIAMALACHPKLLICDEPTTALDVTIQAQVLDIMKKLRNELGMGMILITHDLGVIAETADDVAVMYAGRIVEYGSVKDIFSNPKHPYTKGLLKSLPTLKKGDAPNKTLLETIPGIVPSLANLPQGCRFQDRCSLVTAKCRQEVPPLLPNSPSHLVSCFEVEG